MVPYESLFRLRTVCPHCFTWVLVFPLGLWLLLIQHSASDSVTKRQILLYLSVNGSEWQEGYGKVEKSRLINCSPVQKHNKLFSLMVVYVTIYSDDIFVHNWVIALLCLRFPSLYLFSHYKHLCFLPFSSGPCRTCSRCQWCLLTRWVRVCHDQLWKVF